jgi:tRNA modification GTPase
VNSDDTIAAIATAAGAGGVGIVRLSGPHAIAIAAAMLGVEEARLDRRVRVGVARDASGARVDEVLAFAMRGPASFTGEDVAELHGHGGRWNLDALLAAVVTAGARVAEPGEFTRRAVANGRLDLARAEALLGVISAGSARAWRLAQDNLGGRLGAAAAELEARVIRLRGEIEGRIDFPEDDLAAPEEQALRGEMTAVAGACQKLASGFRHAQAVSRGVTVALVGEVNAGKSSLLNALVGTERALVAAAPGTTRDYLEVADVWDGVAVMLVDTAGTRETADPVERRGIELGAARVAAADVVVVVADAPAVESDAYGARAVYVRSKADLGGAAGTELRTSAKTGEGLEALRRRVLEVAGVSEREGTEDAFVSTARQHAAAAAAAAYVAAAAAGHAARAPGEIVALELREASRALAELRGVEVGDRVLDDVFARFCIGK